MMSKSNANPIHLSFPFSLSLSYFAYMGILDIQPLDWINLFANSNNSTIYTWQTWNENFAQNRVNTTQFLIFIYLMSHTEKI
jgi:hypothetical protein